MNELSSNRPLDRSEGAQIRRLAPNTYDITLPDWMTQAEKVQVVERLAEQYGGRIVRTGATR